MMQKDGPPATSFHVQARWLQVILLFVAIVAWMIFILACIGGPAWSPDGSQILFAYRDVANARNAVALYDRTTGAVTTIFAQPAAKSDDLFLQPRWQKDGSRALIAVYQPIPGDSGDGHCELISIPVKSSVALQAYALGVTEGCTDPYPQLDGKAYFGGKDLRWIDLATGEPGSHSIPDGVGSLSERNDQLFYLRSVSRNTTTAEGKPSTENGKELGRLDLKDFTLKPSFTLWGNNLPSPALTDDLSPVFWEIGGPRMAMISSVDDSDKILLLDADKGITRTLIPDLGAKAYHLGNLVWSPNGKSLYASALIQGEQKKTLHYGLAEIPLDGTPSRFTKIATIKAEMDSESIGPFRVSMQVSLSPDGSWIAATPAVLGKDTVDESDRALFLIDVQDAARPTTRVPISAPASPAAKTSQ